MGVRFIRLVFKSECVCVRNLGCVNSDVRGAGIMSGGQGSDTARRYKLFIASRSLHAGQCMAAGKANHKMYSAIYQHVSL